MDVMAAQGVSDIFRVVGVQVLCLRNVPLNVFLDMGHLGRAVGSSSLVESGLPPRLPSGKEFGGIHHVGVTWYVGWVARDPKLHCETVQTVRLFRFRNFGGIYQYLAE